MQDKIIKLTKIKTLFDEGLISQVEFDNLKNEVLGIYRISSKKIEVKSTQQMIDIHIKKKAETKILIDAEPKVITKELIKETTIEKINKDGNLKELNKGKSSRLILLLILTFPILITGIYYLISQSNNNHSSTNTAPISDSKPSDSVKQISGTNINEWLKKATGYDFNIDNSRISFDKGNFSSFDSTFKFNIPKPSDDKTTANLNLNYYNDYILIEYRDDGSAGKSRIYLTSKLLIYSVHFATTGITQIYNLITKKSSQEDVYITGVNGNDAEMIAGGHDSTGRYVINSSGKINLLSGEVSWDKGQVTSNNTDGTNNFSDEDAKTILRNYYNAAELGGNLDNLNTLFADNLILYQDEHNISKDKAILGERKYFLRWSLLESSILDFSLLESKKYHYKVRQKLRFVKDPSIEKIFEVEGSFGLDENNKINYVQDEKTTRIQ